MSASLSLVHQMVSLIESQPAEPHTLQTLAGTLNRQAAYLGRLFRQHMGVTVREYVANIRLDVGARLVRNGEKVEAVALEVGWRSKKNFYRQFKKRFGVSPAAIREEKSVPLFERRFEDGPDLDNLQFRSIGPAAWGGPVSAIAVVESEPSIFYVGAAGGGLWKTVNNGTTWRQLAAPHGLLAGAIAVTPSNVDMIVVGSGDADHRDESSNGDGIFKSSDGGRSWDNIGLRDIGPIGRIIIDPEDPEVMYATASAHVGAPGSAHGLYKTGDGGNTWDRVLVVNDKTRVTDLAMHPADRRRLLVATCEEHSPEPDGDNHRWRSVIYESEDGASTWNALTLGLAEGEIGRVGLDICRHKPNVVYARIESPDGGVFLSEDCGETWRRMTASPDGLPSGAGIKVDPQNDRRVYLLGRTPHVSNDGGKTFCAESGHDCQPRHRVLWIDPQNSRHIISGTDSGVYASYDATRTWHFYSNLPIAHVSRLGVDMRRPYFIFGALEGQTVCAGPSATVKACGIVNEDWIALPAGSGFCQDPGDPSTIYAQRRGGEFLRYDSRTGRRQTIRPEILGDGLPPKWDANAPIVVSPHDPSIIYVGADSILRSTDRGVSWAPIGPDLPRHAHCDNASVIAVAECAHSPGLLYAGTDRGEVYVTLDGGTCWTNVTERLRGSGRPARVSCISTSPRAAGTAYLALDASRQHDCEPHVFMTTDAGQSWTSIASNLPRGPVNVIREDPRNPHLSYVGSRAGLFVSLDRGARWTRLRSNLPPVPVTDVVVHPRDNDLVVATRGAGVWILDNVALLQEMETALGTRAHLFEVHPGRQRSFNIQSRWMGDGVFSGANPAEGTTLSYYLRDTTSTSVKLAIRDSEGTLIRELQGRTDVGINHATWDLRLPSVRSSLLESQAAASGDVALLGAFVIPGDYQVTLQVNGEATGTRLARVEADPTVPLSDGARHLQQRAIRELTELQTNLRIYNRGLRRLQIQLRTLYAAIRQNAEAPGGVRQALIALERKVRELQSCLARPNVAARQSVSRPERNRLGTFGARVYELKNDMLSSTYSPSSSQLESLRRLRSEQVLVRQELDAISLEAVPSLKRLLEQHALMPAHHVLMPLPRRRD